MSTFKRQLLLCTVTDRFEKISVESLVVAGNAGPTVFPASRKRSVCAVAAEEVIVPSTMMAALTIGVTVGSSPDTSSVKAFS